MNLAFFISLLFGLQFLYWFVGRRAAKGVETQDDYFFAGRSVRLFPLMMTFIGSQVGGGVVLGGAEEAYKFGWPALFFPMGSALGLMLLGSGVGRKLAQFKVSTVAEIFTVVYSSDRLRKFASILSVLSLFMILVAQVVASHKFLGGLGFTSTPLFIGFWAIVILYTVQGGLRSVISTDLVQAAFFSIVFLSSFAFVMWNFESTPYLSMPALENLSPVSSKLWGWLLMPLLFMVIEQDMGQRCFAGASPRVVARASFLAGVATLIICVVPVFFGSLAKTLDIAIPVGGNVLMAAIAATTNPWIAAFVGCAVLAAIISTSTSLISAISSNLSSDFQEGQTGGVRKVRIITAIIGTSAIFFAFYFDNIVDLLIQSYDLSVSSLFIPLAFALYKKRGYALSAWTSVLFGASAFISFRIYPIPFPREVASILFSLLGYGVGEMFAHYRRRFDKNLSNTIS